MDATIGRYRVRMEESGLLIRHEAGINFEFTVDESSSLLHFLKAYQQTLQALSEHNQETEPRLPRILMEE
jgi:hypothetical protein